MKTKQSEAARRQRERREKLSEDGWVMKHVYVRREDVLEFDELTPSCYFKGKDRAD